MWPNANKTSINSHSKIATIKLSEATQKATSILLLFSSNMINIINTLRLKSVG